MSPGSRPRYGTRPKTRNSAPASTSSSPSPISSFPTSATAQVCLACERENLHIMLLAADPRGAQLHQLEGASVQQRGGIGREHRIHVVVLAQALQARGGVHRVADGRVFRALRKT